MLHNPPVPTYGRQVVTFSFSPITETSSKGSKSQIADSVATAKEHSYLGMVCFKGHKSKLKVRDVQPALVNGRHYI